MTRDDVKQAVMAAILKVLATSDAALAASGNIDESVRPIGDLEGFDSLNVVEIVSILDELLPINIEPQDLLRLENGKAPTIGQMVDRIYKVIHAHSGGAQP